MKKYKVTLTSDERLQLEPLIAAGQASALKQAHARVLLKADAAPGGLAWSDSRIAEAVEVSTVDDRAPGVRLEMTMLPWIASVVGLGAAFA